MLDPSTDQQPSKATRDIRSRRFPVRRMVPNMVTLLALCLGLTALRQGLAGHFETAMICIIIAAFLDAFDGRLARLLKAESPFGAQLDSLADFVNFGIVPALLVYLYALEATERLGWAVILVFSVCCALRLARFNVDIEEADRPAWKMRFFNGVPSPAAGGLVMLPMFLEVAGIFDLRDQPMIIVGNTVLVALLMVSKVPTFSGKGLSPTIRRDYVLPMMLGIGLLAVMAFTFPWITLSLMSATYYALLPVSWWRHRSYAKAQA
jgi:CDP-diacylglycerol--serine O-phosphatidyltransferase